MRKKKDEPGYTRFLDHWNMPANAGDPVGCITTSFTFQADFFEEECLSRFLGIESNEEEGIIYLIEREEKLSCVDCVSAWVDQHYAEQIRNMRWDLIPFRLKQGILHAKVSILRWTNHIRVLVGSANMTEPAYRKNREIMVALDLNKESFSDKKTAMQIIESMIGWLKLHSQTSKVAKSRSEDFLRNCIGFLETLPDTQEGLRYNEYISYPIIIEPGQLSLPEKAELLWKQNFGQVGPTEAHIVSPFFDTNENINLATDKTVEILRKKGPRFIHIYTSGEVDQKGMPYRLNAPESIIKNSGKYGPNVSLEFSFINPFSEAEKGYRSLHTKSFWFDGTNGDYMYISGSSNFTAKGLGLVKNCNIEACIVLLSNSARYPNTENTFLKTWLKYDDVDCDKIKWQPLPNEDAPSDSFIILPDFFRSATIKKFDGSTFLELEFLEVEPPNAFTIKTGKLDNLYEIVDRNQWESAGRPLIWQKKIPEINLSSFLYIYWDDHPDPAILPIIIENQHSLPTTDELRNLPINVLMELITSAKPLHTVLRKYLKRESQEAEIISAAIDPLKKYSSSTYLLQRTRKYSMAINQIQEKLETPFPTLSSLEWRLFGPVGMMAAVDAILKESKSNSEAVFFLSEIWKTLGKVKPKSAQGCLSVKAVSESVYVFRDSLLNKLKALWNETDNVHITDYSKILIENF